jgi:hypothetical protein
MEIPLYATSNYCWMIHNFLSCRSITMKSSLHKNCVLFISITWSAQYSVCLPCEFYVNNDVIETKYMRVSNKLLWLFYHHLRVKWAACHQNVMDPQASDEEDYICVGMLWIHLMHSCKQPTRGSPPTGELRNGLTAPHHKNLACYIM